MEPEKKVDGSPAGRNDGSREPTSQWFSIQGMLVGTLVFSIHFANRIAWLRIENFEAACFIAPSLIVVVLSFFIARTSTGVFGTFTICAFTAFLSYFAFRLESYLGGFGAAVPAETVKLDSHAMMGFCLALTFGLCGVFLVSILRDDPEPERRQYPPEK